MNFLKSRTVSLILTVVMAAGAVLLAYPTVANLYNTMIHNRAVGSYTSAVTGMSKDVYEGIFETAEEYNEEIGKTDIKWYMTDEDMEEYGRQLAITESGAMGYIEIPKISQRLIIYHGTEDEALQSGVGHMEGTSLPVGGESSHCVLSGHRGLPSAMLFSDLDKLVEGDNFIITILDRTLTYEVDQIRIVTPLDFTKLMLEKGEDLVTLVTCTPYGVNTHRLLVRGHRVANASGEAAVLSEATLINSSAMMMYVSVPILLVIFLLVLMDSNRRYRYKRLLNQLGLFQKNS